MHQLTELENEFANTLKSIARRQDIKAYIEHNPAISAVVRRAAAQYVTGVKRQDGIAAALRLTAKGYAVSLEFIGENTTKAEECEAAYDELAGLIMEMSQAGIAGRVSFDLSHIGLMLGTEVALEHLLKLAEQAEQSGIELFISMEESAKTDRILSVYEQAVARFPAIGITLQAQLHRTEEDLAAKLPPNALVRIVKGAYQEPKEISIPRSKALDDRYLSLVEQAILQGHRVSIATLDERLIDTIADLKWTEKPGVEFEMLYGIRADISSRLKEEGHPIRIYLTYGDEWYLYLCHRIAEYPPNLYTAVTAMISEEGIAPLLLYR